MYLQSQQQKGKEHSFAKEGAWPAPGRGRSPCPLWRSSAGCDGGWWRCPVGWSSTAGTCPCLTGVEQSQEQYVALLSHLLPIRLCWGGDCAELVFLLAMNCNWDMRACKRRSPPSFLFGWALVCLSVKSDDPAALTCIEFLAVPSSLWGYGGQEFCLLYSSASLKVATNSSFLWLCV